MWTKLDDALIDHPKVHAAGAIVGKNGAAIALGFYTVGLLWTNRHLTDGHLPLAVVRGWAHVEHPIKVADALVRAGLWERNGTTDYVIHDFLDHNFSAAEVQTKRAKEQVDKARAGRVGGLASARVRAHQKGKR